MRLTAIRGPLGLALLCLTFAHSAHADAPQWQSTGYLDRIKTAQTIQPLGQTPFGETVDLYKGGLSFNQTDISFPGIGPTITISRQYTVGVQEKHPPGFGDWSLNIPRIETIIPGNLFSVGEWKSAGGTYQRCSTLKVSPAPYQPLVTMHWWNGVKMITPDGRSQNLLSRDASNTNAPPSSMGAYGIVTTSNWMVGCTASISNPGTAGFQGQGYVALSPDGTKYYFDHLVYGAPIETLIDESHGQPYLKVARKMGYMYLSKIVDRFNNEVDYTYNGDTLVSIDSVNESGTDNRHVAITWTNGSISSITIQPGTPAAQTWNYTYSSGLSSVELPDHSKWQFSMGGMNAMDTMSDPQGCGSNPTVAMTNPLPITITHPSGLIGTFNVDWIEFSRSKVPNTCNHATLNDPEYDSLPPWYLTMALMSKSVEGPGAGFNKLTWTYSYSANLSSDPNCSVGGCWASINVDVNDPTGTITRYTHSAEWGPNEGKLLSIVHGISPANPAGLSSETHEYAPTNQGAYPSHVGNDPGLDYSVNDGPIEYLSPEKKVTITQQGVTFTRLIGSFDQYANPLAVTRSSTGGSGGNFSKNETLEYDPTTTAWSPGRQSRDLVTVGGTPVEVLKTDYDAVTALPIRRYSFGLLNQTLTYNSNGTLSTIKDGNNNVTALSQWYRGIPKLVTFASAATLSATVDAAGKIQTTTDEFGNATSYGYDAMGRLSSITYPTGDTVAWNPLLRGVVSVATAEYGLPAGHWKQTVQTGNAKSTTFYDARFLPVLTLTEDTGNAASKSFVVQRFDGLGRQVFKSYPVATLGTINDSLLGVSTTYDGLGRPVSVAQDSELGVLTTNTQYLSGFQTRVTNPRGYSTTTSYQVFDTPSTDAPVRIDAPQGVSTVIMRDTFGAPLSITRSGPGN